MDQEDLFKETTHRDPWGSQHPGAVELDLDLIRRFRLGSTAEFDDVEVAVALLRLVWDELQKYGTNGSHTLTGEQIAEAQRSLKAVLGRLGINLGFPWRDFEGFRTYWLKNDGHGSWQARREILSSLLSPIDEQLERLENQQFRAEIAYAVSPRTTLGWPEVDEEIDELRRRFRTASTRQDYRDVGNRCVATLEAIGRVVYDPQVHLREGEEVPSFDKSKQRIERYVEDSLAGKENEKLRGLSKKVIELAHSIKHSSSPTRRSAGIVSDAVILLANILKRVDQDL